MLTSIQKESSTTVEKFENDKRRAIEKIDRNIRGLQRKKERMKRTDDTIVSSLIRKLSKMKKSHLRLLPEDMERFFTPTLFEKIRKMRVSERLKEEILKYEDYVETGLIEVKLHLVARQSYINARDLKFKIESVSIESSKDFQLDYEDLLFYLPSYHRYQIDGPEKVINYHTPGERFYKYMPYDIEAYKFVKLPYMKIK